MQLTFHPGKFESKQCLIMVGGSGDTADRFAPVVKQISRHLPNTEICTFTMTETTDPSLTHDTQVKEVEEVIEMLLTKHLFKRIDIFCTSMGAYSTSFLLNNPKYSQAINRVIFFDPADYYTDHNLANKQGNSWSGPDDYLPVGEVASDKLRGVRSNLLAHVVKLTVRNYGKNGYVYPDYDKRGEDVAWEYPRLNTKMVMSFYDKLPGTNKGQYIEINHLPHAFLRDGNIEENQKQVVSLIVDLLS